MAPSEESKARRRLGALGCRAFRWYFIGQTASRFGSSLSSFALAFAVLAVTHSASLLAAVILASRLPVIAFVLVGGVIGDRFARWRVMAIADTARTLLQGVTASLLVSGHATIWSLALLQAGSGTASAVFSPAASGLVANIVPPGQLRQATSLLSLSASVGQLSAIAVAGILVATIGSGAAFAVDAATFAVSTATLRALRAATRSQAPPTQPGLLTAAAEGWQAVRSRRWLLAYSAHAALLNTLAVSPFLVLGPLLAQDRLGGAPAWAAIVASYSGGGLAGNAIALRFQPRRPLLTAVLASTLLTPLLALLAITAPVWILAPAALLAGAQASSYNAWASSTTQAHLPDHIRSRAASIVTLGSLAAVPLGMSFAGAAAANLGTSTVFAIGAVWSIAGALAASTIASLRRLPPLPVE